MPPTHEVFNQSTPFENRNLYGVDAALQGAVAAFDADWAAQELEGLGAAWGTTANQELARLANEQGPVLKTFDRFGNRVDEVLFHPAWHELMRQLVASGAHGEPWAHPRSGAQAARAAKYFLWSQLENGTQCPTTMTFAAVPVISKQPALAPQWLPKLLSRHYDPRALPLDGKLGALMGMGMTEKQGGSDLRANTTRAERVGQSTWGDEYLLTGHKWFFSAPQCDAHLVLAKIDGELLSCFFVPRLGPEGERNSILIQRLKNKVGNRSNASGEIELEGARGWLVGEAGRGVATILEMGNLTRLDCSIGAAGLMRAALTHAMHHARERSAFGRRLAEQPLMRNVLADLALESEAATWLALRVARCYDDDATEHDHLLRRVLTPVAKYWICKRVSAATVEAMEVFGGNGYVEEAPMGRFFRESPLNSIWEGSGNVMCLDFLRAMSSRAPEVGDALREELEPARGTHPGYDRALDQALGWLTKALDDEAAARLRAEQLALLVQASLLLRYAPSMVADAFVMGRLQASWRGSFGTLPAEVDTAMLVARALPG